MVKRPKRGDRLVDEGFDVGALGDVTVAGERAAAGGLDEASGFLEAAFVEIGEDEVSALLGKALGDGRRRRRRRLR